VIAAINPDKDVDGFHPSMSAASRSACRHWRRVRRRFAVMLEKSVHGSLAGLETLVIGRSTIVGTPLAQLLIGGKRNGDRGAFEVEGPICDVAPCRHPVCRRGRPGKSD
jgi:5,10-methylene-tetrahydrofolate dehydrogenase/methenyl tetrahydrofolate cyclohydrolase